MQSASLCLANLVEKEMDMLSLIRKVCATLLVVSIFSIEYIILPWQLIGLLLIIFGVDIWTPLDGLTHIVDSLN